MATQDVTTQQSPGPGDVQDTINRIQLSISGLGGLFAGLQELKNDAQYNQKAIGGMSYLGEIVADSVRRELDEIEAKLSQEEVQS
ncbi:hypothetical protein [Marinimicrobium sp. ABcell2]|uniref:hypothetical protein n=1 Tax=Marinimicrobium sp. ABcell2 TaxID=3069751 RepID=UPI0027B65F44|nr:hypothetical protein [Marinimicrobium sp. ABcell2]MDQ2077624.1 hypothetical protein [Marinimicrobium sp. ABcell2]